MKEVSLCHVTSIIEVNIESNFFRPLSSVSNLNKVWILDLLGNYKAVVFSGCEHNVQIRHCFLNIGMAATSRKHSVSDHTFKTKAHEGRWRFSSFILSSFSLFSSHTSKCLQKTCNPAMLYVQDICSSTSPQSLPNACTADFKCPPKW